MKGPEDRVFEESGAVVDAWIHRAVMGTGEYFHPRVECPFYSVLEQWRVGPLVGGGGRDVFPSLGV